MLKSSLALGLVLCSSLGGSYGNATSMRYPLPGTENGIRSYTETCYDCVYNGDVLSCSCRRSNGRYNATTLDVNDLCPNSTIQNIEGNLTCDSYR